MYRRSSGSSDRSSVRCPPLFAFDIDSCSILAQRLPEEVDVAALDDFDCKMYAMKQYALPGDLSLCQHIYH
jgi:hypothetical protein